MHKLSFQVLSLGNEQINYVQIMMVEGKNNEYMSNATVGQRHVSIGDAAALLGVSIDTVRRWEKAGKLSAERLDGKNRYFSIAELEDFKAHQPLSSTEVAKLLGVSASTVRRLDAEGTLPATRSEKGRRLYDRALVAAYANGYLEANRETVETRVTGKSHVFSSVVEALEEVESAVKHEAVVLRQVEEDQTGGLGGANLHLPFSGWKISIYLAILAFGTFALLNGAGFNGRSIFSIFNAPTVPKQGVRTAGAINLQSFTAGQEAGDIAIVPIGGSQIKDGSIESVDIAEGVITRNHLSNDLQQLLSESGQDVVGMVAGPRGPRGLQGETGPQGPSGVAGAGSAISDILAGLGLSGGGSTGSISLGVNTANGVTLVGDAVEVRLATSGTSSTTSSASGMELSTQGLRLLGGCGAGNILKWNGSEWSCSTDSISGTLQVVSGGTGSNSFTSNGLLFGNGTGAVQSTIAGSPGQVILANATGIPTFTTLSGDVTINSTGVTTLEDIVGLTAGTYGNATQVAQIVVDTTGRITGVTNTTITGVTPGGSAAGDLSGTYPNPSVVKINGNNLGSTTPTSGNILLANGTQWASIVLSGDFAINGLGVATIQANAVALGADTSGTYTSAVIAGNGISVTGTAGEGWSPLVAVVYGTAANTAAEGDTSLSFTGSGNLTGSVSGTAGGGFISNTLDVVSAPSFSSVNATTFTGALVGNSATATALQSNPNDCAANQFASAIDASGNLSCAALTKSVIASSGTLGFTWQDSEVSDTLTIGGSSTVADAALSTNVTKLGSAIDLASLEVSGQLRATSLQIVAADLGAADVNINLGNTNGSFNTNLTIDGVVAAASFTGTFSGNATTATALASNPTDCTADTYATAIAASGNLTCASITDAALSGNITKLGATITKDELTSTGLLGFTWSDAEVSDTLAIGAGSTVADGALSVNVTKLGSVIDLASGEVSGNLRAISLQSADADLGAADVTVNLSNSNGSFSTNLILDGSVTAASFSGTLTGNASTATNLAANPTDCASNSFAHSIDNGGNLTCSAVNKTSLSNTGTLGFTWSDSEVSDALTLSASATVADGALSVNVTKLGSSIDLVTEITGNLRATNLQVAATDLGAADVNLNLSNSNGAFNTNLTLDGTITATTFSGALSGNAMTATALAADPSDCAANQFAAAINASGTLSCAALNDGDVPDTLTIGAISTVADGALSSNVTKLGLSIQNAEVDDDLTISASGSVADGALSVNVTKLGATIDLATGEVNGNLRANNLQAAAADLGAADVTVNLGNTNGSFSTNLILDGSVTAGSFVGPLTGNASTATALASDPTDCGANTFTHSIAVSGNLTCSSVSKTALANSGTLGFSWSDSEVNDNLTLSAAASVADGALSVNVTKLGSAIDLATSEVAGQLRATNLQIAAADLGAADVNINLGNSNGSFNTNLTIDGVVSAASFSGTLSGNATTATALAADPTDCATNQFATAIAASGNLSCVALTDSDVPDTLTVGASSTVADAALSGNVTKLGSSIQNAEVDDDLTISASGSVADGALSANVTKLGSTIDLATGEVSGNLRASSLQAAAADLGAADVTVNLGNSNGSFSTNLILDGSITATSFIGSLTGNASTATALASDPSDCGADTYATTIAASGNLTCAAITDAALSSNITKLGATITKDELTGTGTLGFSWSDAEVSNTLTSSIFIGSGSTTDAIDLATAEIGGVLADANVADTLTVGASSTVADGSLSVNVTKLGASIQNSEVDDDLTVSASGTVADGALSSTITKLGTAIDLATSEVSGQLRATNFQNSATDLGAAEVNINLSNSNGAFNTHLTIDGVVTASSFSGSLSGNAATATALAANPSDCGADTYATTIAASGSLTCAAITDAALSSNITKLGATITKDELTGTGTLGFSWSDSEIVDTLTIGASSTVADAALSGNVTKLGSSIQNAEVDDDLTISASGTVADGALSANVTKLGSAIDLATSEISGQLRANNLQNAGADLGAANVDVVLSNTNGAFVTNLTVDGTVTATTFSGALSGNASTATALAANPSDCAADTYAISIVASGNLTCSTVSKTGLANSGTLAFTWADAEVSDTLTSSLFAGAGSSTTAVDLATAEVAGNLRASNLQSAAADLGAADVTVNLTNSNSSFNTNLTLDGNITTAGNINTTAGALQLNGVDINTAGTLTNVAYENQANAFTVASSFTAAGTALSVTNDASIGGSLSVGSITIGASGTPILKHLSGTATNLVSASIGAAACGNYGTITVTGAAVGDTVYASPWAQAGGIETVNLDYMAIVTAANTVTIRACNPTLGGINTADTQEWRADVWQH